MGGEAVTAMTGRGSSTAASRPKASSINCPPLHRYGSSYVSMPASTASSHAPMAAFDPGANRATVTKVRSMSPPTRGSTAPDGAPATDQIVVHGMRVPAARAHATVPHAARAVGSSTAAPTSNSASVVASRPAPNRTHALRFPASQGRLPSTGSAMYRHGPERRPPVTERVALHDERPWPLRTMRLHRSEDRVLGSHVDAEHLVAPLGPSDAVVTGPHA